MKNLLRLRGIIGALAGVVIAVPLSAQTPPKPPNFTEGHQSTLSKNPPDVNFSVRLKDDQTQFHMGETIRLELSFSSSKKGAYAINAAGYDRSGRMNYEYFVIDPPEGAVDPLENYFSWGGFTGGGLTGFPKLGEKPFVMTLPLNEWRRFEKPGEYRLYVQSVRLQRGNDEDEDEIPFGGKSLTSNIITFTVLPYDEAWAAQALREATQVLDGVAPQETVLTEKRRQTVAEAIDVLRFLDTPAAAREMARRYERVEGDGPFAFYIGLLGSSHGDVAVAELERRMKAPDETFNSALVYLLARLKHQQRYPQPMRGVAFKDTKSPEYKAYVAAYEQRSQALITLQNEVWSDFARTLTFRKGNARIAALYSLAQRSWGENSAGLKLPSDFSAQVIASFADFDAEAQGVLLERYWKHIKQPAMLPHLQRLLLLPGWPSDREMNNCRRTNLRNWALRRLRDLDAKQWRAVVLQEIARREPRMEVKFLTQLPDATLPQLEETLIDNLEEIAEHSGDSEAVCALIERYATAKIAPRVKKLFGAKDSFWPCAPQASLLAYFLRVDPAYARAALHRAIALRNTACRQSLFGEVAPLRWTPLLEEFALAQLNNPDPMINADAAAVLGKYGSPRCEAALWKRLETWHARWQGRADDLRYSYTGSNRYLSDARLERALWEALATANNWTLDRAALQKLKALMVSRDAIVQAETELGAWSEPLVIQTVSFDPPKWLINRFEFNSFDALKRKLAQFPRGTAFQWPQYAKSNNAARIIELTQFLKARGMQLKVPTVKPS